MRTTAEAARHERIDALADALRHYDPSQLTFQLSEIAGDQIYLQHGIEVGKDDVVLDVGANVGVASVFFATQCGARVVHSFEPVRPIFELLTENVRHLPACVVHEQGLAAAPGRAAITYYPGSAAMSGLYAEPERDRAVVATALRNLGLSDEEADVRLEGRYEPKQLECELRTVSSVLADERIDRVGLLKIDVERAEMDVLCGVEERDWSKIEQLVLELHDEKGRCAAITEMLCSRGFGVVVDQDPVMRNTPIRMLYAIRR